MSADMLTTADVAAYMGVTSATVRSYVARGVLPPPDGRLGRTPWWHRQTVAEWKKHRPGQGKGGGRPRKPCPLCGQKMIQGDNEWFCVEHGNA